MGFWLKSFDKKPAPLPGTFFTVPQINNRKSKHRNTSEESALTDKLVPILTTGVLIIMGFIWGWLSDGPCRGARWPFVYAGAVITVIPYML